MADSIQKFHITQRQYDIIIQQCRVNYPKECGGFLGGENGTIKAILPTHNLSMEDKKKSFGISRDDIDRAHAFFAKYKLQYYGVYHSHPNGVAHPSMQDMKMIQRYLFIIAIKENQPPAFVAFRAIGYKPVPVPLDVISNKGVTALDIPGSNTPGPTRNTLLDEAAHLSSQIEDMKHGRLSYPHLTGRDPLGKNPDIITIA